MNPCARGGDADPIRIVHPSTRDVKEMPGHNHTRDKSSGLEGKEMSSSSEERDGCSQVTQVGSAPPPPVGGQPVPTLFLR